MCGITGIYSFSKRISSYGFDEETGIKGLKKRGPDYQSIFEKDKIRLGHCRLSILDPSPSGHQPMSDSSGRYTIILNGEIYNYKSLSKTHLSEITLVSNSDTEVLLHLLIKFGKEALQMLNGFFSFCFYDSNEDYLLIARDRLGIKPLVYYKDEEKFIFASELKSLLEYDIPKELNHTALYQYLQFNYLPENHSILVNTKKLLPGFLVEIQSNTFSEEAWWQLETRNESEYVQDYNEAVSKMRELLIDSVEKRMLSDVPLGSFLSGGVDSSIIAAIAARKTEKLKTYSIGFSDDPYFDETAFAEKVAKHIGSEHSVFKLSHKQLLDALDDVLDYLDEPFADSSALPVYILSQMTRKEVTVSLSGDGSDELFAGYNKHRGHYRAISSSPLNKIVKTAHPLLNKLPKSRDSWISNKIRQVDRFSKGINLSAKERYWQWASIASENDAMKLFTSETKRKIDSESYNEKKQNLLRNIKSDDNLNQILSTDITMLLPSDMLRKVDLMSMASSLEVRVPFLDHRIVEFANYLPAQFKIDDKNQKRILKDAFSDLIPEDIFTRSKKGFEVPLLSWFKNELKERIENEWLNNEVIEKQNIFDPEAISQLKQKLWSNDPGDSAARIWALIVFQNWYKKYLL